MSARLFSRAAKLSATRRSPRTVLNCRRRYATESTQLFSQLGTKPSPHGQPLFESHPHLLLPNELTPGIPAEEYERRRKQLMDSLPESSLVVCVAAPVKYMSGHIFYKFRQSSDFWYLTGFEEPDSAVVLEKNSTSRGYRMIMFSHGKDSAKEKWEGARTSFPDIISRFHADDALPISSLPSHLKSAQWLASHVYTDVPSQRRPKLRSKYLNLSTSFGRNPGDLEGVIDDGKRQSLSPHVAPLRNIKSKWEQAVMRDAANVSGTAHAKTMCFTGPESRESAVAAHFEYVCALAGAQRPAYVPVVASGANALIIHYTSNNHIVRAGDLVLIDAGCEYNGYASDITRTFPASGSFTPAQKDLYSAILRAQRSLNQMATASSGLSLNGLHRKSVQILWEEIIQLPGWGGGRVTKEDVERELYPHHLSHPIGIDLHESTYFDRNSPLQAGNVITIEPGIYVPPSPQYPKEFHNLGIRIEDEVLVGEDHATVLTVNAPKEVVDVEGACQDLLGVGPY